MLFWLLCSGETAVEICLNYLAVITSLEVLQIKHGTFLKTFMAKKSFWLLFWGPLVLKSWLLLRMCDHFASYGRKMNILTCFWFQA